MAIIDISRHILEGGRIRRTELINWLTENVGEYYGRGENDVIDIGLGWEIIAHHERDGDYGSITTWQVDITDEEKSVLFALKWV